MKIGLGTFKDVQHQWADWMKETTSTGVLVTVRVNAWAALRGGVPSSSTVTVMA